MIFILAAREVRSLFLSPLAWCILAISLFILGYLFLSQVDLYLQAQSRLLLMDNAPGVTEVVVMPVFANAAVILLLVMPLLTMRLVSEERRNQTLSLLLSAPISMTEIIIGKYLGIMAFICVLLLSIMLMPLSLLVGSTLDWGMVFSGFIGLALLLASFAAAGLYMSTLTAQPVVAAVGTFGLLLLLWIIDWAGTRQDQASNVLHYLSLLKHYQSLLKGVINTQDIVYYLLFIVTFLVLSIRRLDADRLQH